MLVSNGWTASIRPIHLDRAVSALRCCALSQPLAGDQRSIATVTPSNQGRGCSSSLRGRAYQFLSRRSAGTETLCNLVISRADFLSSESTTTACQSSRAPVERPGATTSLLVLSTRKHSQRHIPGFPEMTAASFCIEPERLQWLAVRSMKRGCTRMNVPCYGAIDAGKKNKFAAEKRSQWSRYMSVPMHQLKSVTPGASFVGHAIS